MERVQYQQEQTLAELREFIQKGLFSATEVKQIIKCRTAFEAALVRRFPRKIDFLKYAAYEAKLERLRKKRAERLKIRPSRKNDYAGTKRHLHVLERAVGKFKADVALWVMYIKTAQKEGARKLVGRITARALQLHPNMPSLYILAAAHELDHGSPGAARALLQRGVRMNARESRGEVWREWVRMEMGFVETVRRRWGVLGIVETDVGGAVVVDSDSDSSELDDGAKDNDTLGAATQDETARSRVMDGAIVKEVISSALKAIPTYELFTGLREVIRAHPSPESLRRTLLEHLYEESRRTINGDPRVIEAYATRGLPPLERLDEADEEKLVDALRNANEELLRAAEQSQDNLNMYVEFVEKWCEQPALDENLRRYLMSNLRWVVKRGSNPSSALLAAHLRLLMRWEKPSKSEKTLCLAKQYTERASSSAQVWLARLEAEQALGGSCHLLGSIWRDARRNMRAAPETEEVKSLWVWGLEKEEIMTDESWQEVLKESTYLQGVHDEVLMRYASFLLLRKGSTSPTARLLTQSSNNSLVHHLSRSYLPNARVWEHVFKAAVDTGRPDTSFLREIYEHWSRLDLVSATVEWAGWLVERRHGSAGKETFQSGRTLASDEQKLEMDTRWRRKLEDLSS